MNGTKSAGSSSPHRQCPSRRKNIHPGWSAPGRCRNEEPSSASAARACASSSSRRGRKRRSGFTRRLWTPHRRRRPLEDSSAGIPDSGRQPIKRALEGFVAPSRHRRRIEWTAIFREPWRTVQFGGRVAARQQHPNMGPIVPPGQLALPATEHLFQVHPARTAGPSADEARLSQRPDPSRPRSSSRSVRRGITVEKHVPGPDVPMQEYAFIRRDPVSPRCLIRPPQQRCGRHPTFAPIRCKVIVCDGTESRRKILPWSKRESVSLCNRCAGVPQPGRGVLRRQGAASGQPGLQRCRLSGRHSIEISGDQTRRRQTQFLRQL